MVHTWVAEDDLLRWMTYVNATEKSDLVDNVIQHCIIVVCQIKWQYHAFCGMVR